MQRFVSIILIVMILTSQGLVAIHAHFGTDFGHSASHCGRPHFHVHGSHSHSSHHDSRRHHHDDSADLPSVSDVQIPTHDSDAFYCTDSVVSPSQRTSGTERLNPVLRDLAVDAIEFVQINSFLALDVWPNAPRQWSNARTLLYLRDLSIRC